MPLRTAVGAAGVRHDLLANGSAFDRGVLDGSVHPLDLKPFVHGPRGLSAMLNLRLLAGPIERVPAVDAWPILGRLVGRHMASASSVHRTIVGELDAVIHQHRVDCVRHGSVQIVEKGCRMRCVAFSCS